MSFTDGPLKVSFPTTSLQVQSALVTENSFQFPRIAVLTRASRPLHTPGLQGSSLLPLGLHCAISSGSPERTE